MQCTGIVVLAFIAGVCSKTAQINNKTLTLQHVQIMYRHGDRSPTGVPPNDPNTWNVWPQGFGQLSTRGMDQHLKLGELIRQTYAMGSDSLLSPVYLRQEVYASSDDEARCLNSASANFAGLYPSCGQSGCPMGSDSSWPNNWTPVPVHTMPKDEDYVLHDPYCPAKDAAENNFMYNNATSVAQAAAFADIAAQVSAIAGYTYNMTLDNMWEIWDPLYIEINWGTMDGVTISPPTWWNQTIYGTVVYDGFTYTNLSLFEWVTIMNDIGTDWMYEDDTGALYAGGPVLNQLIWTMQQKVKYNNINTTDPYLSDDAMNYGLNKYVAYSTHDTTIWALLRTMNDNLDYIVIPSAVDPLPKYAAAIAFELWGPMNSNNSADFYINIYYHDGTWYNDTVPDVSNQTWTTITNTAMQCKGVTDINGYCSLNTFVANSAAYAPYVNSAMPELCQISGASSATISASLLLTILASVLFKL